MKRFINKFCYIALCIILSFSLISCNQPKDKEYVYNWLLENGELINGTELVYSDKIDSFHTYKLCYSSNMVGSNLCAVYVINNYNGYNVSLTLPLYTNSNNVLTYISIDNAEGFERGLEYYHNRNIFQRKSPITHNDTYGDTIDLSKYPHKEVDGKIIVDVPQDVKEQLNEMKHMNALCEELAQESLCSILDWLKTKICPLADMELSDFGYEKYI